MHFLSSAAPRIAIEVSCRFMSSVNKSMTSFFERMGSGLSESFSEDMIYFENFQISIIQKSFTIKV